jgi:hypothetical protein
VKVPALLAVGAGLLLCGSAAASVVPYQAQSQQIAAAQFPAVTCPVTVDLAAMPATKLALADVDNCTVHFSASAYQQPVYVICAAMVHEYGHLSGLGHSTDPSNVMYPVPTPRSTPLPCLDIDPEVGRYEFTAPAHRRVHFQLRMPHRSRSLDLLRTYVRGRRAREVVAISRFAGEGVHVSVNGRRDRVTIKAFNRGGRRARVQVFVGPGVEAPASTRR